MPTLTPTDLKFFKTPADLRKWLERNHRSVSELWLRFYKRDSGRPSITYPEALDEALCYGWIDGVRKAVEELSTLLRKYSDVFIA